MVCHPVLRIVVSADTFTSITRTDLGFSVLGALLIFLFQLDFVETGPQALHCLFAVLDLRPLVLALHYCIGWNMGDTDSRICRVNTLTARAGSAKSIYSQVLFLYLNINL